MRTVTGAAEMTTTAFFQSGAWYRYARMQLMQVIGSKYRNPLQASATCSL